MITVKTIVEATKACTKMKDKFEFLGVTTDSRGVKTGELFVALKGENFDGHSYCAMALESGAAGVLVENPMDLPEDKVLIVQDTLVAYQEIAHATGENEYDGYIAQLDKNIVEAENIKILPYIHDDDLLRLINELRAAGAEALAVNKERLLDISEIRCAGPTVSVNNTRFSPPYQIIALGEPKTLEGALRLRGGVIETLKFWGISVKVEQSDSLTVPAFKGTRRYEFAKVKEGAPQ